MLTLELQPLPADRVRGADVINGVPKRLPLRSLFLHPRAARSFLDQLADRIVVTDMFRSAEATLVAITTGAGSRAPAFSGHNFGFSIDVEIDRALRDLGLNKSAFDGWMHERGWVCGRDDGARGVDDRHYDFLRAADAEAPDVEHQIRAVYGHDLFPELEECQTLLRRLRMYNGVVDGALGPLTAEALGVFQRAWNLGGDARARRVLDPRTRRTLAYVTHQRRLSTAA
jgi:hypothetical protein